MPDYRNDMDRLKLDLYQVLEECALNRANEDREYSFEEFGNFNFIG